MKKLMSKKKGFTLVELLVVVALIAILMLIALPKFIDSTKGATIRTYEGNFRTAVSQISQYVATNAGSFTGAESNADLTAFIASIQGKPKDATYTLAKTGLTATLKGTAFGGGTTDYTLTYSFSGADAGKIVPAGYADSAFKSGTTSTTSTTP